MENQIDRLYSLVKSKQNFPEILDNKVGEILMRPSFFPVGTGLISMEDRTISNKEVMILGQDWGTGGWIAKDAENPAYEKTPTWRNIFALLDSAGIDRSNCFYTNAFMGVRTGSVITGPSPAWKYQDFILTCEEIFEEQIKIQKPRLIIALGLMVARFLAHYDKLNRLTAWKSATSIKSIDANQVGQFYCNIELIEGVSTNLVLVVHPSLRHLNIKNRHFKDWWGKEAEKELVKACLW